MTTVAGESSGDVWMLGTEGSNVRVSGALCEMGSCVDVKEEEQRVFMDGVAGGR